MLKLDIEGYISIIFTEDDKLEVINNKKDLTAIKNKEELYIYKWLISHDKNKYSYKEYRSIIEKNLIENKLITLNKKIIKLKLN